jgi:hypothetical protein
VLFSVGRDQRSGKVKQLPEVSDDCIYLVLEEPHRSPVNPKEFHFSLRDKLVQEGNQVNTLETVKYSLVLVLWKRKLIPEFI